MDKLYLIGELKRLAEKYNLTIGEEQLERIIAKSHFRVVPKGEILSSIGDDTDTAGVVLSGIARCYYIDKDGNDITRGFAAAGYMCMDEGFFGYRERICMWEAVEELTVMLFSASDIKRMIREDDRLNDTWISILESGMRYKIYRENGFLVENATERYLAFRRKFPELAVRVPQQYIATYLGIAPESLSRIKKSLRENGVTDNE